MHNRVLSICAAGAVIMGKDLKTTGLAVLKKNK
jgi:hypothetical protein